MFFILVVKTANESSVSFLPCFKINNRRNSAAASAFCAIVSLLEEVTSYSNFDDASSTSKTRLRLASSTFIETESELSTGLFNSLKNSTGGISLSPYTTFANALLSSATKLKHCGTRTALYLEHPIWCLQTAPVFPEGQLQMPIAKSTVYETFRSFSEVH